MYQNIDEYAFYDCSSLKSVRIPSSVDSINDHAFANCSSLTSITILNPDCGIFDSKTTIFTSSEAEKSFFGDEVYDANGNQIFVFNFDGTICGYNDSTAEKYAEKYGYKFKSLGEAPFTLGDPTKDGYIDAVDASLVLEEYTNVSTGGASVMTNTEKKAADINSDGAVDASDASLILAYYVYVSTGGKRTLGELMRMKK